MRFGEAFGGLFPDTRGAVLAVLLRTGTELTGRQVHALVRDGASLWSVQQALSEFVSLGLVDVRPVGRANIYLINENHYAIRPLRTLVDPFTALRQVIRDSVGAQAVAVILFGSVARGEADATSDIDLAVLASPDWDGRSDLEDSVRTRLGNDCDVLLFTPDEFNRLVASGEEPVVNEILADGVVLVGSTPQRKVGVA
ncbi:MAG: nucleotidyltransferase domain-containing protein [Micropruina sp.]|nr:nucleotidyltransferase domain-containing protein [Micropruina sp.]